MQSLSCDVIELFSFVFDLETATPYYLILEVQHESKNSISNITSNDECGSRSRAAPKIYVDKGACPFECCTYREWTVNKDTTLYDSVNGKKIVGKATKGTKVLGLTGEVHTIPVLKRDKYGKQFYILTYEGEGGWKIWEDGKVKSTGQTWEDDKLPESTWWVEVKLSNDVTGWAKEPRNFDNKDTCG